MSDHDYDYDDETLDPDGADDTKGLAGLDIHDDPDPREAAIAAAQESKKERDESAESAGRDNEEAQLKEQDNNDRLEKTAAEKKKADRETLANIPVTIIASNAIKQRFAELSADPQPDSLLTRVRLAGTRASQAHQDLAVDMLTAINRTIDKTNLECGDDPSSRAVKDAQRRRPLMNRLGFPQLTLILSHVYTIVRIAPSAKSTDPDLDMLAIYDTDPKSATYGTYQNSEGYLHQLTYLYNEDVTKKDFAEILAALRATAPRVTRGTDPDLIALNNCIYHYGRDEVIQFHPDHVFLSKAAVNYNPDAADTVIHNDADGTDWNVHDWIRELFFTDPDTIDHPEKRKDVIEQNDANEGLDALVWQIIGATLRPYVSWNKCAFFFSEQGNNGKGTLLEMLRNIIGTSSYASIPLADFGKDFMLEPLTRASSILVDENDVETYIDRAANFKAIVTNDVISINRKYKDPIAHQFFGFMVQCLNDKPKIHDKSESLYRRQLFVPFTKSFTGAERRYIKDDYIARDAVLEYIVYYVLSEMPKYYELDEPKASKLELDDFKLGNDPIRAFWDDINEEVTWDLLPKDFLFDLYKAWLERNIPGAKPVGIRKFCKALQAIVANDPELTWQWREKQRNGNRIVETEPLIVDYDLERWTNERAPRSRPDERAKLRNDQVATHYTGLFRRDPNNANSI